MCMEIISLGLQIRKLEKDLKSSLPRKIKHHKRWESSRGSMPLAEAPMHLCFFDNWGSSRLNLLAVKGLNIGKKIKGILYKPVTLEWGVLSVPLECFHVQSGFVAPLCAEPSTVHSDGPLRKTATWRKFSEMWSKHFLLFQRVNSFFN